jgi:hypothetical protein
MTAIVDEDRAWVSPADGAHSAAPLGGVFGVGGHGGFRGDAEVVILGYD